MEGFVDHRLICRACLKIVESTTQSFGYIEDATGNLRDMLLCCVPEMVNILYSLINRYYMCSSLTKNWDRSLHNFFNCFVIF